MTAKIGKRGRIAMIEYDNISLWNRLIYYCTMIEGYDPNTDVYNTDVSDADQ